MEAAFLVLFVVSTVIVLYIAIRDMLSWWHNSNNKRCQCNHPSDLHMVHRDTLCQPKQEAL